MADPVSISMGLAAAGGVVGAFGAAKKDDAATAMYNYKAGVAQANQQVAMANAAYSLQAGGVKAQQEGLRGAETLGAIKVAQAGSGFNVAGKTATDVRTSQTEGTRQAQGIIANEAQRREYAYKVEGMNFAAEQGFDRMGAEQAQAQKPFDVASSLLGGATSVADKWFSYSRAGATSSTRMS